MVTEKYILQKSSNKLYNDLTRSLTPRYFLYLTLLFFWGGTALGDRCGALAKCFRNSINKILHNKGEIMKLIDKVAANRVLMDHANDKLTVFIAYKLMKLLKSMEEDITFYRTKMSEIIDEYAEKDPNGQVLQSQHGGVIIQNGKADECNSEIKELEEMEVSDNCEIKFTLEELAPINFSVNEMLSLECYIEQ